MTCTENYHVRYIGSSIDDIVRIQAYKKRTCRSSTFQNHQQHYPSQPGYRTNPLTINRNTELLQTSIPNPLFTAIFILAAPLSCTQASKSSSSAVLPPAISTTLCATKSPPSSPFPNFCQCPLPWPSITNPLSLPSPPFLLPRGHRRDEELLEGPLLDDKYDRRLCIHFPKLLLVLRRGP